VYMCVRECMSILYVALRCIRMRLFVRHIIFANHSFIKEYTIVSSYYFHVLITLCSCQVSSVNGTIRLIRLIRVSRVSRVSRLFGCINIFCIFHSCVKYIFISAKCVSLFSPILIISPLLLPVFPCVLPFLTRVYSFPPSLSPHQGCLHFYRHVRRASIFITTSHIRGASLWWSA
jgi:hypothetical protein